MSRVPVILDVDTGIDDAFSILLADSLGSIEVLGIATVAGNVSVDHGYRNTCYIKHLLGMHVPVARGCAKALAQVSPDARQVHGDQGLGDLDVVPDFGDERPLGVFEFYESLLAGSSEPVTIIANGPMTNLACLILACPHLKSHIARIVFMGGGVRAGNATPCAEFNIRSDPEAARVVLDSGIPLVMAGLDITHTAVLPAAMAEGLGDAPTVAGKFFADLLGFYVRAYGRRFDFMGAPMHDSVTVAFVAHPELFTWTDCFVTVDIGDGLTRGATIADGRGTLHRSPNVRMLESIDLPAFLAMTRESMLRAGVKP